LNAHIRQAVPTELQPRDVTGAAYALVAIGISAVALWFASAPDWRLWFLGQLLTAIAFQVWFALLHEAGHQTLFRSRALNSLTGHLASVATIIPYCTWQRIHARHHHWTGWQDLDPTTASLVPRTLKGWERWAVNAAWRTGFPLFSILYRLGNFWNVPRVFGYLGQRERRIVSVNTVALVAVYGALVIWIGPLDFLRLVGVGILLGLALQDPLILSQHTHIPQRISGGERAEPIPASDQESFTRSLRLPAWLSKLLLHIDAHALHHMHVNVPGYDLMRIAHRPMHEVDWWRWLTGAKRLKGEVFLFQNADQTGFRL
jgi:acyl-lipid omega-6 desaturase (Delta-12 desaturase)